MIDAFPSGLVALVTAALLYIGAHDWAGVPDEIIIEDALAFAGFIAVGLGFKLLQDQNSNSGRCDAPA